MRKTIDHEIHNFSLSDITCVSFDILFKKYQMVKQLKTQISIIIAIVTAYHLGEMFSSKPTINSNKSFLDYRVVSRKMDFCFNR